MTDTLITNALLLDVVGGELIPDTQVLVTEGRIHEVGPSVGSSARARVIDLQGRVLMPGLCDAHVHVTAGTADFARLQRWSPYYVASHARHILNDMLMRGFTTVRDAGGADFGLAAAIEEGLISGPRLLYCGKALSQTGGHGDMRDPGEDDLGWCFCCAGLGRICDGVSEVRRAARDEIRKGANHIKLMVSGGVSSPTDRISSTQFSREEITAAVEETDAAELYCMAHAYTARAINRALECGVRSIEHGNLLDQSSVDLLVEKEAFLVPTLSTFHSLAEEGTEAGMPAHLVAKVHDVLDAGLGALELAHRSGVKLAYGTDLLGVMHRHQSREFSLRGEVQAPLDVIRAATINAADLFGMEGEIGRVAPGARADLIAVDGNPLEDLGLLQGQGDHMPLIMKDGAVYKHTLS